MTGEPALAHDASAVLAHLGKRATPRRTAQSSSQACLGAAPGGTGGREAIVGATTATSGTDSSRLGEPVHIDAVFRDNFKYVASIGLRLLGSEDETDDLIQDVFVVAAEGLHRLREPAALKGWLASITVRLALRRLRLRRFLRLFTSRNPEALYAVASRAADPENHALLREVCLVLDELPAPLRVAWILRHMEDEPIDRVAMLCDCSLTTAKRRIAEARYRIRKLNAERVADRSQAMSST